MSVVRGLTAGDLVMDACPGGLMDHLLGRSCGGVRTSMPRREKVKEDCRCEGCCKRLAVYLEDG